MSDELRAVAMPGETDSYVTNAAWLRTVGRPDLIDDVADQFERPVSPGAQAFYAPQEGARWPRTPAGWRNYHALQRA